MVIKLLTKLCYKNVYMKLQFAVRAKTQKANGKMTLKDVDQMSGYLHNVQNAAIFFDCNQLRNVKIASQKSMFDQ